MASFILSSYARTALANAVGLNTLLDGGEMKCYTAANGGGTLLVTHTLPDAANNTPSAGVLTLGAIANANGVANGVANFAQFLEKTSANLIADADCGTATETIVFDNNNIAVNQVVSISSANFTVPAGT